MNATTTFIICSQPETDVDASSRMNIFAATARSIFAANGLAVRTERFSNAYRAYATFPNHTYIVQAKTRYHALRLLANLCCRKAITQRLAS